KLMNLSDGKIVSLFGLAYKGNVDDIRESPAMEIYKILNEEADFEVRAFDPHVMNSFVTKDIEEATKDSDLVVILTDHDEFKKINWDNFSKMNNIRIFDTKNIVQNHNDENVQYINFGNLYNYIENKIVNSEKILG